MRWHGQRIGGADANALPGLERLDGLVRSVTSPDFAGITFHEVAAKSALNQVPGTSIMPFEWTINPYRGCSHACTYCFARGTHEYLEFDAGRDFDSQIVVKVNIAEVLAREVARSSWHREHVALGTNTDPYQRAEGKYRLMPGIIEVLANSSTPFSVLTKGTMIRRDLATLVAARERTEVEIGMSIAVFDDHLQKSIEPGTPSAAARLTTLQSMVETGFSPQVFLAPVFPYLTDDDASLNLALDAIRETGARRLVHSPLTLRPGVKPWFFSWLERERPDLVPKYRGLYPGVSVIAPTRYRQALSQRLRALTRKHGFSTSREDGPFRGRRMGQRSEVQPNTPEPARLF